MRIVTLKDAVAVAVEAERDPMDGDHGMQGLKIAERVLGFELEVGRQDLAGGVILEGNEGELGAALFPPRVAATVGQCHHAHTGPRQTTGPVLAWPFACL